MKNNRNNKSNLVGFLGLVIAIITLLFGDNLYERLTGRPLSLPKLSDTPTEFTSPSFDPNNEQTPTGIPATEVFDLEPDNFIPAIKARMLTLKFFESGYDVPPYEQRTYYSKFDQETTRFVNWELFLYVKLPEERIDFSIHSIYYDSTGSILREDDTESYFLPEWDGIVRVRNGWGWEEAGKWLKDTYTVVLYTSDIEIARASFTIE